MSTSLRPQLLLSGAGDEPDRWAATLGEYADVLREHEGDWSEVDGLVLTEGAQDPFSRAKEALVAGKPVLYAARFVLSPWQAGTLARLSHARGVSLRFVEPLLEQQAITFLRRLFEGREPLWQPLYLRIVRLAEPGCARIDELAPQELAVCDALLGRSPEWVQAAAARGRAGEVAAVFITVQYPEGVVVQCTVSLAEGRSERTLVAATGDRTVVLDDLDAMASLRIGPSGRGRSEAIEHPALAGSHPRDRIAAEASRFARAVVSGGASVSNAERWARVAGMWWAARQSMSFGGPVELPATARVPGPPPLHVIKGGGKSSGASRRRPALTLVAS